MCGALHTEFSMWNLCQFLSRLPLYYRQSVYKEPISWEWYPSDVFIHCIDINNSVTMNWRHHHDLIFQISIVHEIYKYAVSFATTNDVLCISVCYSCCIRIVSASSSFISALVDSLPQQTCIIPCLPCDLHRWDLWYALHSKEQSGKVSMVAIEFFT